MSSVEEMLLALSAVALPFVFFAIAIGCVLGCENFDEGYRARRATLPYVPEKVTAARN